MTIDELKKVMDEKFKDDYCDCDHTPRCPHCGKKMRPWQDQLPYRPMEPYRPLPYPHPQGPIVTW